jgi:hypothetical protein
MKHEWVLSGLTGNGDGMPVTGCPWNPKQDTLHFAFCSRQLQKWPTSI